MVALRPIRRIPVPSSLALLLLAARVAPSRSESTTAPVTTRAIVISFDALNEQRVTETIPPARIPALRALFSEGACAESAQPAYPTVTAAGHASLWTGTYGDVNGIAANAHLRLPASQHTILETANGFGTTGLRAEPIWITAGAAGLRVFAHHVTQAPGAPGYPTDDGEPVDTFRAPRERARAALAAPSVSVLNGYNRVLLAPRLLTRRQVQLTDAGGWRGVRSSTRSRDLAFALPLAPDSLLRGGALHVLLRLWPAGDSAQLFAAFEPDLAQAVQVVPHAEDLAPARGRPLARYFSAPVVLPLADGRRASMRLRLFTLSARDTSFTLFIPGMQLADANSVALTNRYVDAVPGWVGNSALTLWETGGLGTTVVQGGDGTAEWRWLESAELLTRGFMEGAAWGWRTSSPQLMLDYFPLGDDTDHALWGYLDPRRPGYDAALAARLAPLRERLWELLDLRLAGVMQLASTTAGTRLFVAGDHGMRGAWRTFRPNAALRDAGLLTLDADGRIDLTRSRAASANGYWISVNRVGRLGGIVPRAAVDSVMDEVRAALLAVRDPSGAPVVTEVVDRRDARAAWLGIGGVAGGDVYFEVAEGFGWNWEPRGAVVEMKDHPVGWHGSPSTSRDMHTVSCEWGAAVRPAPGERVRRPARLVDVVPAVQRWLGMAPTR